MSNPGDQDRNRSVREGDEQKGTRARAFRGLVLVFFLSFLNLTGIALTAFGLGVLDDWGKWRFAGLFGAIEVAAGLASIYLPNIWHLPVAEAHTRARTEVKLAASSLFLPHWGALARVMGGLVILIAATYKQGVVADSWLIAPEVVMVAVVITALSLIVARLGVAKPALDVVEVTIGWNGRDNKLPAISIGASVVQFLLGMITIPAAAALAPSLLFAPELRPADGLLLWSAGLAAATAGLAAAAWSGRITWQAPADQQVEIEANA